MWYAYRAYIYTTLGHKHIWKHKYNVLWKVGTGQGRWKKLTRGNDERKWCAWWVLNGWPVGQTLSDCLLKGWKTRERDDCTEDKKETEHEGAKEKRMIIVKILLSYHNQGFPSLMLHGVSANASGWLPTKDSEIEKWASSMFYSTLIT